MRTTWIILTFMFAIGGAMYYMATRREPPGKFHTFRISNMPDSLVRKVKVYGANNEVELHFANNAWIRRDSSQLPLLLDGRPLTFIDKTTNYSTLFITFNGAFFYDLDLPNPVNGNVYTLEFRLEHRIDSIFVSGTIDNKSDNLIQFRAPMMRMYSDFLLTYNKKLDGNVADSLFAGKDPRTTKTITVFAY